MILEGLTETWKRVVNVFLWMLEDQKQVGEKTFQLDMFGGTYNIPVRLKKEALKGMRPDSYPEEVYPMQYDTYLTHPINEKSENYLTFTPDYYWKYQGLGQEDIETFKEWAEREE